VAHDKISILVVDDEADMRELLERGLGRAGYHCVMASGADQAARLLQGEAFTLVLLDVLMPGKSGMELLSEIIARYPDTGVVMLTGVADAATGIKAMREGALDYVTKPFALDVLTDRIEHALHRTLMLRERAYQQNLQQSMMKRTEQLEQRVRELEAEPEALNPSASMSFTGRFLNPLKRAMTRSDSNILVVDDNADFQELLARGLARAGYHCVTASGADQAAQLLQGEAFALVLLDIMMPGKSGMEFLPEIIARYPDTGVVMLTGVADTVTAVKAMREGALDYVTKPINLDELGIRMDHALARRALLLQNRDHQEKLERMVADHMGQLEQPVREVL
jgi:DNA-binding NtrC family response regulator